MTDIISQKCKNTKTSIIDQLTTVHLYSLNFLYYLFHCAIL